MQKSLSYLVLSCLLMGVGMFSRPAKALEFEHSIETTLPPQKLWSLLTEALSGVTDNGFWPTRYSTISGQVEENGIVTEMVFGSSRVTYRLTNVIPGTRLTYTPLPGEAMQGQSHIEVLPPSGGESGTEVQGSTLHWYGTYEVSSFSPIGLTIRLYEQLFFRALRKNLAKVAAASNE
jgi:hypothetical protein